MYMYPANVSSVKGKLYYVSINLPFIYIRFAFKPLYVPRNTVTKEQN